MGPGEASGDPGLWEEGHFGQAELWGQGSHSAPVPFVALSQVYSDRYVEPDQAVSSGHQGEAPGWRGPGTVFYSHGAWRKVGGSEVADSSY